MINHFPHHTVQGARSLNACQTFLLVHILGPRDGDYTNNGITSPENSLHRNFFVPHPDGPFTLAEIEHQRESVIMEVIPPAFAGCPYRFKVRGEKRLITDGGNYLETSDSRFSRVYGGPIAVHDRIE